MYANTNTTDIVTVNINANVFKVQTEHKKMAV